MIIPADELISPRYVIVEIDLLLFGCIELKSGLRTVKQFNAPEVMFVILAANNGGVEGQIFLADFSFPSVLGLSV